MKQVLKLMLEDARIMMDGAINKALEIGVDMDIALTFQSTRPSLLQLLENQRQIMLKLPVIMAQLLASKRHIKAVFVLLAVACHYLSRVKSLVELVAARVHLIKIQWFLRLDLTH